MYCVCDRKDYLPYQNVECVKNCDSWFLVGKGFAELSNGGICRCSTAKGTYRAKETDCNLSCNNSPNMMCGGVNHASIYYVTKTGMLDLCRK